MATAAYKRWTPPTDTSLLLLEGVSIDLFSALDSLELLAEQWSIVSPNPILVQALATSAIVSYARPFASGRRQRMQLSNDFQVSEDQTELHKRIIEIRNKHVAHPVNEFETHAVFISYHVEAPEPIATGIATGSMLLPSIDPQEVEPLIVLCRSLLEQVHHKRAVESSRLLELAKQLKPTEILALPEGPLQASANPSRVRGAS